MLAVTSPLAATLLYAFQKANPVNPVALLAKMEQQSPALPDALATGKPTLVEFYGIRLGACAPTPPSRGPCASAVDSCR